MTLPHESNQASADDELIFAEEEIADAPGLQDAWTILIVDDDQEVHQATLLALQGEVILGKPLIFCHAYSAEEARTTLQGMVQPAVILLDVVMESDDAGLKLVRVIREELQLTETRIILRTGQPGYAPELTVIRDYDINDYKAKDELTRIRLITTLTAALRSYRQIRMIGASRRGLEMIVQSAAKLFGQQQAMEEFADGVLTQLAALLDLPPEGLLCAQRGHPLHPQQSDDLFIVGAAGNYRSLMSRQLHEIGEQRVIDAVHTAFKREQHYFGPNETVLYICLSDSQRVAVFLDTPKNLEEGDKNLLELFSVNIGIGIENVSLVDRLHFAAYYDPLTHLPNRTSFITACDQAMAQRLDHHTNQAAIACLLDINQFSVINDALGHHYGDALLQMIADRLQRQLPKGMTLARVAGDNFAMLAADFDLRAEQVLQVFAAPFRINNVDLPVRVTLGLTQLAEVEGGGSDVLKCANIALNRAKATGRRRYEWYAKKMAEETRERISLLADLKLALDTGFLQLYYQPKIHLASGRVVGAEALLRWRHQQNYVAPDLFISVAESSGLIVEIGSWVLQQACLQSKRWRALIDPDFKMAINVSMGQLQQGSFANEVAHLLVDLAIAPSALEVEITETMAMLDADSILPDLRKLQQMGVSIAIDDFGTGFSSLGHLQNMPLNTLKIDRAFVQELASPEMASNGKKAIADTIMQLGSNLRLSLVAEGVEQQTQADYLKQAGCDFAQGYLYSPALPAAAFEQWAVQWQEEQNHRD
ncbi:EAL domain-containing protein [Parvibium lacunae]|uniref:EAL domain-containing protein n=1 Tax=Parvibium lacunae TaxID=1888893 RepID=A0A368L0K8_9BURK|nr:EAL domain-containing protein [Parvibium lacunae]RCS57098.1 EAL domain-containing protein [Parvibium lacunae]